MTPLLADAGANAANIGNFVLAATALATLGTLILGLLNYNRTAKREVTFSFTPASKAEFDKHVEDTSDEIDRLDADIKAIGAERKIDVGDLHEKVNGVALQVAGLAKGAEIQNQQTVLINQKLDNLIARKS